MKLDNSIIPLTKDGNPDYKSYIMRSEYDFLADNEYLGKNICLLALGGSRSHGTNLPDSDVDIRGISANSVKEFLGLSPDFSSVVDEATDTTIYSIKRAFKYLVDCNPNTMEMLGLKPDQYLYISKYGQKFLDHKKDFLSVRAIDTFGGYANRQYNRLLACLMENGANEDIKAQRTVHSMKMAIDSLNAMKPGREIYLTPSIPDIQRYVDTKTPFEPGEIRISGAFDNVPVVDLKDMISSLNSIYKDYNNINKRNSKKDVIHLNKHCMHLIRLYFMGTDLNATGEIITYREKEHDLLMSIRNGEFLSEDGLHMRDEFFDMLKDVQDKYLYAVNHTVLPEHPNDEALQEMMVEIGSDVIKMGDNKDTPFFIENRGALTIESEDIELE
jgi:predicted nucleotidyltransferase